MAGGSWTAQNKVRPGIYINFTSRGSRSLSPGERGTLAGIRPLSWGPVGEIMEIDAGAHRIHELPPRFDFFRKHESQYK